MTFDKSVSNKKYYEKNKENIMEHLKEMIVCEVCNREYHLYLLSRHNHAKLHLKNLKISKSISTIPAPKQE